MNEELIKQIGALVDELKETNNKYQIAITDKSNEFQELVSDGKTKVEELRKQISDLKEATNSLLSLVEKGKGDLDQNSKSVSEIGKKIEAATDSLSDLEKRFLNLGESLAAYEELKKSVDQFQKRQTAIEVELVNFQKKLENDKVFFENTDSSIESLKKTDLYKLFVEGQEELKANFINEVIDSLIENVQVKNKAFKSKLDLERKSEPSKKEQ
ncbi:MAG: hypothetical protein MJ228_02955 [Bacilli bacterium]|nr:hypothetical protein [Bacilli bacterium]